MNAEVKVASQSDLDRLRDLPGLIADIERKRNGMKSDLKGVERKLTAIESRIITRIADEKRYTSEPARKAALVCACEDDAEWLKLTNRQAELDGVIRSYQTQIDHLRREKDTLQAIVIARSTAMWKDILADQKFAEMVGGKVLA